MHDPGGDGTDSPEDESSHESRPEAVDRKALDDARGEPDEQGVDNKGEETEGNDANREGEKNENRTDKRIQETDDEGGNEGAIESVDVKAGDQFSDS